MDHVLILAIVGCCAGILRSILGFISQSPVNEKFNLKKIIASCIRSGIAGIIIAITFFNAGSDIRTKDYIMVFLMAMGADVGLKESFTLGKKIKRR